MSSQRMPWWAWTWPVLALGVLATTFASGAGGALVIVAAAAALIVTVFAAVYHAEVVGERVGEPFGNLVLALVITVIKVALIVSVMLNGGPDAAGLARDTMFATVMIILNGLIGISLLLGGLRHHEQGFQVQGAGAALAVLAAIMTLTLVLPNFTTSVPGPVFTTPQLAFAGIVSLVLYCGFMFVQTVRHRDHFLYPSGGDEGTDTQPPSLGTAMLSTILLLTSLVAVVGLAKTLTPALNAGVTWLGTPKALLGIVIALPVLLPESIAALRAAYANQLQASINLAFRSALASVGLTIPAISLVAIMLGHPLALGLRSKESAFMTTASTGSWWRSPWGGAGRHRHLRLPGGLHAALRAATGRLRPRHRVGPVCGDAGRRHRPGDLLQRRAPHPSENVALNAVGPAGGVR